MTGGSDPKQVIGFADTQLLHKYIREQPIVMLTGVDEDVAAGG